MHGKCPRSAALCLCAIYCSSRARRAGGWWLGARGCARRGGARGKSGMVLHMILLLLPLVLLAVALPRAAAAEPTLVDHPLASGVVPVYLDGDWEASNAGGPLESAGAPPLAAKEGFAAAAVVAVLCCFACSDVTCICKVVRFRLAFLLLRTFVCSTC